MRTGRPWAALLTVTAALAGCGSGAPYANDPRPPQLVTITSAIAHGRVAVSPTAIGAGPVMLVVANIAATSQSLSVTRSAPDPLDVETGPINPGSTATLQIQLDPGTYAVKTDDPSIAATQIVVGPSRPSAQNSLDLP